MWEWEAINPGRSGSSGDLAKLFKNESVAQPGILAKGAPSPDASLLAREVIQNSWDAARELRREEERAGRDTPEFDIVFRFHELSGPDKADVVRHLGLDELAHRASGQDRSELGLAADDCLQHLHEDRPLQLLEIDESGTTGMYGPWRNVRSKLYLALVSLGFTVKDEGAGGSYGYGKSGLIRGSKIRTVFAYTCFREQSDDPGVTRRALGMTYWGLHDIEGTSFNGFARLGRREAGDEYVRPFENDEADERATRLRLRTRSPYDVDQLGSTFILVDPTVSPEELVTAIERNWWPAILDSRFNVVVRTASGEELHPRPRNDDVLRTFIRAYEVATVAQDYHPGDEFFRRFQSLPLPNGANVGLGTVGLVSDATSWSWPRPSKTGADDEDAIENRSLVALVRGPRMVVEYHDCGGVRPYVRGAFMAHPDVDDLLRRTEPKAHDAWQTRTHGDDISPDATAAAVAVQKRVRTAVNDFRRKLQPPATDRPDIRLPVFEDLFRDLVRMRGSGDPQPPHEKRQVSIRVVDQDLATSGEELVFRASATMQLTDHVETEEAEADVELRFVFVEDGRLGEAADARVQAPEGWAPSATRPGRFHGVLRREPQLFTITTQPYSPDWTGRLIVAGDLATPTTDAAGEEVE